MGHLILFSILGTLARLGVVAINSYPEAPVDTAVLWANAGGSFLLGLLVEDCHLFREEWGNFSSPITWSFHPDRLASDQTESRQEAHGNHGKVKKTIPLFIGLATGFCGCFTSFSSFISDAVLALINVSLRGGGGSPTATIPRNGGHQLEAGLAIIIVHVATSAAALRTGSHLAGGFDAYVPTIRFRTMRKVIDPCITVLGFGCWLGAVFISIYPPYLEWRGEVTMALVFGPVGCLFRFYLCQHLNPRRDSFPLGTFAANFFGTVILGACFDLQHSASLAANVDGRQVLAGIIDGFCGCGTTVSTWIAELHDLTTKQAYFYGFCSVAITLISLVVIINSFRLSVGFAAC